MIVKCEGCDGTGNSGVEGVNCFRCHGAKEVCSHCGECPEVCDGLCPGAVREEEREVLSPRFLTRDW